MLDAHTTDANGDRAFRKFISLPCSKQWCFQRLGRAGLSNSHWNVHKSAERTCASHLSCSLTAGVLLCGPHLLLEIWVTLHDLVNAVFCHLAPSCPLATGDESNAVCRMVGYLQPEGKTHIRQPALTNAALDKCCMQSGNNMVARSRALVFCIGIPAKWANAVPR